MLKAVITCGGTGGHITPALAIAELIRQNFGRCEILFVGTVGGMEESIVTDAGYPLRSLAVKGLPRKPGPAALRALYLAARACREAERILEDFAPQVAIGTGGYACYPTLRAAASLSIPTAVHESNAVPGLAVRMLARSVDRVWLNFEEAGRYFKGNERILTVGNPLRSCSHSQETPVQKPRGCRQMVLSFGGSLGAERINEAVLDMMAWERSHPEIYHLHATGKRGYAGFMRAFTAAGLVGERHLRIVPFISDMPRQMAAADVVICRAGAMSISELAAAGKAAVLIPSPNVTGDHQTQNARALAEKKAAFLLGESELNGTALIRTVSELLWDEHRRHTFEKNITAFAHPEVGRLICEDLRYLLKKG